VVIKLFQEKFKKCWTVEERTKKKLFLIKLKDPVSKFRKIYLEIIVCRKYSKKEAKNRKISYFRN